MSGIRPGESCGNSILPFFGGTASPPLLVHVALVGLTLSLAISISHPLVYSDWLRGDGHEPMGANERPRINWRRDVLSHWTRSWKVFIGSCWQSSLRRL